MEKTYGDEIVDMVDKAVDDCMPNIRNLVIGWSITAFIAGFILGALIF